MPISTFSKSRKNENLFTTFQQPKLDNQTQMSITTSPHNRNVHKIPIQIKVEKLCKCSSVSTGSQPQKTIHVVRQSNAESMNHKMWKHWYHKGRTTKQLLLKLT